MRTQKFFGKPTRRSVSSRDNARLRHAIEPLESRTLLSAISWVASTSGDFNVATNWSSGTVPGPGDDVTINQPGVTVTISSGESELVNSLILESPLDIEGSPLTVAAGITINGTMLTLGGGAGAQIILPGAQTIGGTGNIHFASDLGAGGIFTEDAVGAFPAGGALTIASGITIDGTGVIACEQTDCNIISSATINADQAGGGITLNNSTGGTLVNSGLAEATAGTLTLGGSWDNTGTLAVSSGATLDLGGNFLFINVGTLNNTGGTVNITGIVDNSNNYTISAATGSFNLVNGEIDGGTLDASGGAALIISQDVAGEFNGVTLGAGSPLTLDAGSTLNVFNGLTLSGTSISPAASSSIDFKGTQDLAGTGTITFGTSGSVLVSEIDGFAALTIDAGITIDGTGCTLSTGASGDQITNDGTIAADGAGGVISITNGGTNGAFVDDGMLGASNGGTLNIEGNYVLSPNNVVNIGISSSGAGVFEVTQQATLAGTLNISLLNGYVPLQGSNYTVTTYVSSTGAFTTINGLTSPGVVFTPSATATSLTLQTTMGSLLSPTTLTLQSSATSTTAATPVTFTATLGTSTNDTPTATGSISFFDNGTALGTAALDATGIATLTTTLPVGVDLVSATYPGDSNYAPPAAAMVSENITAGAVVKKIGVLDPTFGIGGVASHNVGMDYTGGVYLDAQGQAVIVGTDGDFGSQVVALTRYNADGSVDTSFNGGIVHTPIGDNANTAAVFHLPDGDTLVAGTSTTISNGVAAGSQFFVAEYTPDGNLDTTFGNGAGFVLSSFSTTAGTLSNDVAQAIAVSASGEIFVSGSTDAGGKGLDFAIAAFNADGSPATTFGTGGHVEFDIAGGDDSANAIALQGNGDIVVAGSTTDPTNGIGLVALSRFLPDGTLDKHFGAKGVTVTSVRNDNDGASALEIDSKGRFVVGGYSATGSAAVGNLSSDFLLLRYSASGKLDRTFGHGGAIITTFNQPAAITSVDIAADGTITASGKTAASLTALDPTALNLALAHYTANGLPDVTFNGTGQAIINLSSSTETTSQNALSNTQQQPAMADGSAVIPLDTTATLMQEFQAFKQSTQGTVAMTSGGELLDVGNNNGNTIAAQIITEGIDLAAALIAKLPASVVGGAKSTVSVEITEDGNLPVAGVVTIELFASPDAASTAGTSAFGSFPEKLKLKEGQAKTFRLKFTFPSPATSSTDFLLATVDPGSLQDLDILNNTAASTSTVVIANPFVDLSGSGLTAPVFTAGKPATILFDVTNNGNVPTTALSAVEFLASANGTLASGTPLSTLPLKLNLKAGASKVYKIKLTLPTTLPSGSYNLLALLDPANVVNDPEMGNNLIVSGNMFSV